MTKVFGLLTSEAMASILEDFDLCLGLKDRRSVSNCRLRAEF